MSKADMMRFETLQTSHPTFHDWVCSHRQVVEAFHPSRWASPIWAERVDDWRIAQIFGRSMPEEYFRFLFAYCHAWAWEDRLDMHEGGLCIDPIEAIDLVEGTPWNRIRPFRYKSELSTTSCTRVTARRPRCGRCAVRNSANERNPGSKNRPA